MSSPLISAEEFMAKYDGKLELVDGRVTHRGRPVEIIDDRITLPGKSPEPSSGCVLKVPPQLCVEVRSPSNTWTDIFAKIADYFRAGVTAVLVLDPDTATASVYRADTGQQIFTQDQELTLPDVLPGFSVPVRRFFA